MAVVEGGDQLDVRRAQHPVAEHVTRHVADADDGQLIGVGILPQCTGMTAHALPRPAGRDSHGLVVVTLAAARGKGVAEPEAVVGRDLVGDVAERRSTLVGRDNEIWIIAVESHRVARWNDGA